MKLIQFLCLESIALGHKAGALACHSYCSIKCSVRTYQAGVCCVDKSDLVYTNWNSDAHSLPPPPVYLKLEVNGKKLTQKDELEK